MCSECSASSACLAWQAMQVCGPSYWVMLPCGLVGSGVLVAVGLVTGVFVGGIAVAVAVGVCVGGRFVGVDVAVRVGGTAVGVVVAVGVAVRRGGTRVRVRTGAAWLTISGALTTQAVVEALLSARTWSWFPAAAGAVALAGWASKNAANASATKESR